MIMLLGAFITGFGDLYFDILGYSVVLLNDFATAGYLVFTNKAGSDDLGKFGTIFYNTLISWYQPIEDICILLNLSPMLFILCIIFGDFKYVMEFEYLEEGFFQISFICSAMLAFLVNLTTVTALFFLEWIKNRTRDSCLFHKHSTIM